AAAGVGFDREAAAAQAQAAEVELALRLGELGGHDPEGGDRNWDSPKQVLAALRAAGLNVSTTSDETLARLDHPLARAVRAYRKAAKRVSAFGPKWILDHVGRDGRVHPSWHQLGADTGRMSCSRPNLQQIPRGDARKCFVAPKGRVLIKADYSQVE